MRRQNIDFGIDSFSRANKNNFRSLFLKKARFWFAFNTTYFILAPLARTFLDIALRRGLGKVLSHIINIVSK